MRFQQKLTSIALASVMATMAIAPAMAYQGHSDDKGKGHAKKVDNKNHRENEGNNWRDDDQGKNKKWNPAPPKKNGRHDNRDWNKTKTWRTLGDGTRYQTDGRYYYYNNQRYTSLDALSARRQQTKNEWRNIALVSGAVAVLGLIKKDNRLVFAGTAGALYSLYRYEQDRKSQSQVDRLRASYFSRPYFVRDGRRYDRRVVVQGGQKYYQFVRHG